MKQYLDAVKFVLDNGSVRDDRTGTGTLSVFGYQMRFNLQDGFPAVTTKKLALKAAIAELLWFMEGSTDERRLAELTTGQQRPHIIDKTTIWTANADNQGVALGYQNDDLVKELGPVYGSQWRSWKRDGNIIDQLSVAIDQIKNNLTSRRIVVSAWNVADLPLMALPPCHVMFQFYVSDNKLSCSMYQRSCDLGLGAPFNIASYALLTHLIARECDLDVGDFVYNIGDMHVYLNHVEQLREQLTREPLPLPTLVVDDSFDLKDMYSGFPLNSASLITLKNYQSHPPIKLDMSV